MRLFIFFAFLIPLNFYAYDKSYKVIKVIPKKFVWYELSEYWKKLSQVFAQHCRKYTNEFLIEFKKYATLNDGTPETPNKGTLEILIMTLLKS